MLAHLSLVLGVVAACTAVGTATVVGPADASSAACLRQTPTQLRAHAKLVFDGVALDGITSTGTQRFRVIRYRKGTGTAVVHVTTGWRRAPDGSLTVMSEGITPRKGERWRIFVARIADGVADTSMCSGSRRL